jgi:hypothetical protein
MRLIAFVTDQMGIGRILDHLGLSSPEAAKPPPPAREVLRVRPRGCAREDPRRGQLDVLAEVMRSDFESGRLVTGAQPLRRAEELYHAALERRPSERDVVAQACGEDQELLREAKSLLA